MDHAIYHARNVLLIKILWITLVLGVVLNMLTKAYHGAIIVAIVGTIIIGITNLVIWRKWWIAWIRYLVTLDLSILILILMINVHTITDFLLIFFLLSVISLYHDYRSILLAGILGVALTFFAFENDHRTLFPGLSTALPLALLVVMSTVALIAQSRIGQRMYEGAIKNENEAITTKNKVEAINQEIKKMMEVLFQSTKDLLQNASATSSISIELALAFNEMSSGIAKQAEDVNEVSESMQRINGSINTLTQNAGIMRSTSQTSNDMIEAAENQMQIVTDQTGSLSETIHITVSTMDELINANQKIEGIIQSINQISDQINLLALNASIEAARAGDAGRGFSVVAEEVRKLAQSTYESANSISDIIRLIQKKSLVASTQIHDGQTAVQASEQAVSTIKAKLTHIFKNSNLALQQSDQVDHLSHNLENSSNVIAHDIQSLNAVTERMSATVKELTASVEQQNKNIQSMETQIVQIEQYAEKLLAITE